MKRISLFLLLILLFTSATMVQAITPKDMLQQLFTTQEVKEEWFAPSFKAQVPIMHIKQILFQLHLQVGELKEIKEEGAKYLIIFEHGIIPTHISLDNQNRIQGLFFEAIRKDLGGLEEILPHFRELPGEVSLLVLRDGEELLSLNSHKVLAVGSTFKLAVLAALRDQINRGNLSWSTLIQLKEEHKTLPSGILQDWPTDSPLTLHTLASLMISISDNTATDALIGVLGREPLKEISPHNRPFLSTREAFILKNPANQDVLLEYREAGEEGKRSILQAISDLPPIPIDAFNDVRAIDIEWFFSAWELVSLMAMVGDLPLMAINPGIAKGEDWAYIAYKGGSEPGVLNFTTLLEGFCGHQYLVIATWNDEKIIDELEFISLYSSLLQELKKLY